MFATIYQRLCQAEELLKFPRSFIYELALGCEVVAVHRKLQKESTNETCGLFILKGEISVIQQEQSKTYRAGSLIGMDNTNGNKEFQMVAKEMSAVVKLTKQSMKHALESHPECELLISKNFFKTNS
ncbi:uncharacterized protein LOC106161079 [Lingula anatina]|uniref:Uncharacterized protein LOC106161079 n=1 Tax=Lingula anatina TaxID=7574 RepID=A0A1S3I538_LINAN|nr:uncharacterized protein LOC106161079 [Lingula anatina]|eukprot:XP_013393385.1 uncharacterized protein LOC106161079 [Lingula anatina]